MSPARDAVSSRSAPRLAPTAPSAAGKSPKPPTAETFNTLKFASGRIDAALSGPVIPTLPSNVSVVRSMRRLSESQSSNGPDSALPPRRKT